MIYLDYSATTKADEEVVDSFIKCSQKYFANPNSHHEIGISAKKLIDRASEQVAHLLKVSKEELIYTSGASESNNLAIKGVASKYSNRGKHIITSELEHSSIYGALNHLASQGYEIDIIPGTKDGKIDLNILKEKLRDDTILLSLTAVSSEVGVIEPLDEIKKILKDYPKCLFHVDMTQAITKMNIDLSDIDLASFSAHKFFGLKGIGLLYKRKNLVIDPLIHGGRSTTVFRSGTPATSLIVSFSKALRIAIDDLDNKYKAVDKLNKKIRKALTKYNNISINSPKNALPHILNISFKGSKAETVQRLFEEEEIYISTQTACSSKDTYSRVVFSLTNDMEAASSSVRISLSYKTTEEEIEKFLKTLDKIYKKLEKLNENNNN